MVHIVPGNWNWHEGMTVPVWVYTNCDSVELFLNGKSLGEKAMNERSDTLHLAWEVPYEPGELKAVARKNGGVSASTAVRTAKFPYRIEMKSDSADAGRNDIVYLATSIHDVDGTIVPMADNLVKFTVEGPGRIIGVDNGNPISHEPFIDEQVHAFNGYCLAVMQCTGDAGTIKVRATSAGLKASEITVRAVTP